MSIKIEKFWWNANNRPCQVDVAKVPDSVPNTTGTIRTTEDGKKIVLFGKRRVQNPDPGYRYHEFAYR